VADVFVSCSRRDSEFVGRLTRAIEDCGKQVWLDTEGIADADVFPQAIRSAIEGSDTFVFVITPESVASRYCDSEVNYAHELGKRIVPWLMCVRSASATPIRARPRLSATTQPCRRVSGRGPISSGVIRSYPRSHKCLTILTDGGMSLRGETTAPR
jgi:hypothetical protein